MHNTPCPRLLLACLLALLVLIPGRLPAAGEYAVQFTVPSDKDEVWKFVEMLSDLGYPSYMFTQDRGAGMVHYYAQMGTYASYDAAEAAAKKLQQDVRVDFEIVHANSNKVASRQESVIPEPEAVQPEAAASAPESEPSPAPVAAPEPAPEVAAAPQPAPESQPAAPTPAPAPEPQAAPEPAPTVTATAKPSPPLPPSSGTATAGDTVFLVQLHSFSIKQNALDAARDYARKGYAPVIILLYDDTHTPWYVLSLGHYADRQTAAQAARTFRNIENRSTTLNQVDATFLETRVVPFD